MLARVALQPVAALSRLIASLALARSRNIITTTARHLFIFFLFSSSNCFVLLFLFQVANSLRAILSRAVRRLLAHGSNDQFRHDLWRHAVHHLLVLIPGAMGATQGYLSHVHFALLT